MKKGWIQANKDGAYEDVAPSTLADQVYMDESKTKTVKEAVESISSSPGSPQGLVGITEGSSTFYGVGAGQQNETGFATFIGYCAGGAQKSGSGNTFIGFDSGRQCQSSSSNTFVGSSTGYYTTAGVNTFVGDRAGYRNTSGNSNTYLGCSAGYENTTGYGNVYIGASAGYYNTTGAYNTASGHAAGRFSTGSINAFYGTEAGVNTSGGQNAFLGAYAGSKHKTGDKNTFTGITSGYNIETGNQNTMDGFGAGSFLSNSAAQTASEKSVFIGSNTKGCTSDNQTNQIVIGTDAIGNGSNTVTLGNSAITKLYCKATAITALSDRRVKEAIEPANVDMCVEAVKSLPVTRYKYKDFTGKHLDSHVTGFLADDVEKVFPKSVTKADRYFPVLDENGEQVYEEVEETVTELGENGQEVTKTMTKKVEKMFLMADVKDLTMTEAMPTLWGAMQALIARVEELEKK